MSVQVSGNFLPGMESRLLIIGHEALPGDALISPPASAKEPFFSLFVIPTLLLECNSCKPRPGFSARGRPVTHFHTIASPGQSPVSSHLKCSIKGDVKRNVSPPTA